MAIVKGLLRYGALVGPVDLETDRQGYYESPQIKGPSTVKLGGVKPYGVAIHPLTIGAVDPATLERPPSYDKKYTAKAGLSVSLPVAANNWTDNENDSVTPTDALTFDRGVQIDETLSLADNLTPLSTTPPPQFLLAPGGNSFTLPGLKSYESKYPALKPTILFAHADVSLAVNDSVTPSDALTFDIASLLADSVTPSDALLFDRGVEIDDTLSLADSTSLSEGFDLQLSDNPGVSDNLSSSLIPSPVVFLTLKPYDKKQITGPYQTGIGGMSVALYQNISDSVTPSDSLAFDVGLNLSDNPAIADSISTSEGYDLQLSDNPGLSDNLSSNLISAQIIFLNGKYYDKPQTKGPYPVWLGNSSAGQSNVQGVNDSVGLSDSIAFDVGMEIDDTASVSDNIDASILRQIPFFLTLKAYDKPQIKGPYFTVLGNFPTPGPATNYTQSINDSVSLSDNPNAVTLYPIFLTMRKYDRKQLKGPYPIHFKFAYALPTQFQSASDTVFITDSMSVERAGADDDFVFPVDSMSRSGGYSDALSDGVGLSDSISFISTGGHPLFQVWNDSVTMMDEITLSQGNQGSPKNPGTPGPYMDVR